LYSLVLFAGVSVVAVGCGSDDDTTGSGGAGGSSGKSGSTGTAGKAGSSATAGKGGGSAEAGETGEGGSGGASTLYERLGGYDGIKGELTTIVGLEVADEDIAPFFAAQLAPGSTHKPSATDIIECLTIQLSAAAGGPYTYPAKAKTSGFQCRSMAVAHAGLGIGSDVFDKFVAIAATQLLKDDVSADDVNTIGMVLNSTKPDIVEEGTGGAGGEGGA